MQRQITVYHKDFPVLVYVEVANELELQEGQEIYSEAMVTLIKGLNAIHYRDKIKPFEVNAK